MNLNSFPCLRGIISLPFFLISYWTMNDILSIKILANLYLGFRGDDAVPGSSLDQGIKFDHCT